MGVCRDLSPESEEHERHAMEDFHSSDEDFHASDEKGHHTGYVALLNAASAFFALKFNNENITRFCVFLLFIYVLLLGLFRRGGRCLPFCTGNPSSLSSAGVAQSKKSPGAPSPNGGGWYWAHMNIPKRPCFFYRQREKRIKMCSTSCFIRPAFIK